MTRMGRVTRLLVVFVVVLLAALIGILTRPPGLLATFWCANALLLGMMVRWPILIEWPTWIAAAVAYVSADLLTGNTFSMAIQLNGANLVGVTVGVLLLDYLKRTPFRLVDSTSLMWMVVVAGLSACATAATAGLMDWVFRGESFADTLVHWGSTEFMAYLLVLPLILSMTIPSSIAEIRSKTTVRAVLAMTVPLLATAACMPIALSIEGPIALLLPIPALLWCATRISVPSTALVSAVWSVWSLMMADAGRLALGEQSGANVNEAVITSIAVTLVALGPIAVACATQERRAAERELFRAVEYDSLTGVLSRGPFLRQAEERLQQATQTALPIGLLMLDLDHFKAVNDTYGHMVGDSVLADFGARMAERVSDTDLVGRLGGEEFAVLLTGSSFARATEVAEEIRHAQVHDSARSGHDSTVSIGLAWTDDATPTLASLMVAADAALYEAKHAGRNVVKAENVSDIVSGVVPERITRTA